MRIFQQTRTLLSHPWHGWQHWVAWIFCLAILWLLGHLRMATAAEFTFASLAMFPVLFIAWVSGKYSGLLIALLAAAMWLIGDITSAEHFSADWIPWVNALVRLMNYALIALLAATLRQHYDKEHAYASLDPLTGIANRRSFFEIGEREVERARRYQHALAVIFLDLDHFKQLNDTRGHKAGDAALLATARALQNTLRTSDHIARIGGDEFAVLLPEISYAAAQETGNKLAQNIHAALAPFPMLSCSLGLVWCDTPHTNFSSILGHADQLMYAVKQKEHDRSAIQSCRL